MATLKNTVINDTGYLTLPNGTTAQRPSPQAGMTRYNTSTDGMEFYNGSNWISIGILDGSSADQANTSAAAIKSLTGTTTNGFYWIYVGGVATQVWCDMSNDGGGWMMIGRLSSANTNWQYYDSIWTSSTPENQSQPYDFNGNIKTVQYYTTAFSQVRLCIGSINNGLIENWSGSNFASFMGSSTNSGNSRTTWVNWMANGGCTIDFSSYGNCNQFGTNKAYNYQYIKIGGTINGENDCNTNDQSLGFGSYGISPYGNRISAGSGQGLGNFSTNGWIFIK